MSAPSIHRAQARRLIERAKQVARRPVLGRILPGPDGCVALIGVEDPDGSEAMRVHLDLVEFARAEGLTTNVIVVSAGGGDGRLPSRAPPGATRP